MYQFFSLQHNNAEFSLIIDDQMVQTSARTEYLGVLLDNGLIWTDHICKTVEKTKKGLGLIKRLAVAMWGSTHDILTF